MLAVSSKYTAISEGRVITLESIEVSAAALELAAAWLRILPCAQIAEELERGIDLLASTLHDLPERHRSMNVVLEQSWQRLSDEEQRAFRQLSVFSGQFRPKAAQSVAEASFQMLREIRGDEPRQRKNQQHADIPGNRRLPEDGTDEHQPAEPDRDEKEPHDHSH